VLRLGDAGWKDGCAHVSRVFGSAVSQVRPHFPRFFLPPIFSETPEAFGPSGPGLGLGTKRKGKKNSLFSSATIPFRGIPSRGWSDLGWRRGVLRNLRRRPPAALQGFGIQVQVTVQNLFTTISKTCTEHVHNLSPAVPPSGGGQPLNTF